MKKIWIDLDNTPHIPFFRPIIDELIERGYQVKITARDAFQVYELADYFNMTYQRIGRHYGKNKIMKVLGSLMRALQLVPVMLKEKPDLAVSHGSRTQLIAATILRIPTFIITDYEYAKSVAFAHPTWVMVPEVIPDSALDWDEVPVFKYPGIKEDVYVPGFKPDSAIREQLDISMDSLLVTIRPPATEAHYHSHKSQELFEAVVEYLVEKPNVQIVILPRNKKQEGYIRDTWRSLIQSQILTIPDHAIDGLNLIWFSDLVISGGGTMNREAAALGVPVYSIFRSKIGAVDQYLSDSGRLVLLESIADFPTKIVLAQRDKKQNVQNKRNYSLHSIVDRIVEVTETAR